MAAVRASLVTESSADASVPPFQTLTCFGMHLPSIMPNCFVLYVFLFYLFVSRYSKCMSISHVYQHHDLSVILAYSACHGVGG